MSASLVAPLVSLFSSMSVTILASATVGASLMSLTVRTKLWLVCRPPLSSAVTVTTTPSSVS